jgi:hypothetical protein
MIGQYLSSAFMNIENFPASIALGAQATSAVQPVVQATSQPQAQVPTQPIEGQNVQAQSTAAQVPAQEGGQATQGQGQATQGQGQATQGQGQGGQIPQAPQGGGQTQAI